MGNRVFLVRRKLRRGFALFRQPEDGVVAETARPPVLLQQLAPADSDIKIQKELDRCLRLNTTLLTKELSNYELAKDTNIVQKSIEVLQGTRR